MRERHARVGRNFNPSLLCGQCKRWVRGLAGHRQKTERTMQAAWPRTVIALAITLIVGGDSVGQSTKIDWDAIMARSAKKTDTPPTKANPTKKSAAPPSAAVADLPAPPPTRPVTA